MVNSLNPWWLLLTSIPFSLSGGNVVLFTGAYSFIKDTSSPIDASLCLGTLVGSLSSSYLIVHMGYSYVLIFTATVNVITYLFVKIWIIESLSGAEQGRAGSLFNCSHLKDMLKGCFKHRPNKGRNIIILMAIIKLVLITVQVGWSYLEYLYLRNKLNWSLRVYTTYSAVSTITAFFGAFLGVMVIERLLRIGDITFVMIALTTAIIDYMIKAFATQWWQIYLSIFVSPFKGLPLPLINSYVSKFLPEEDIAKVFALLCAMESVAQIIAPIIFNSLYSSTLSVFPGAIYILSAVMNVICLVMLIQVVSKVSSQEFGTETREIKLLYGRHCEDFYNRTQKVEKLRRYFANHEINQTLQFKIIKENE
ncbi:hypothetical protein KGM_210156 [Danaus plexippus plexippus]|uniref:Adenylate cyclase n=1 Tax=Danaus plexippus plexippus TaxID=278856 RepID=A0A212EMH6_DANPL|nr:hypothetical protein KGM_210156 [Danaus plexippus plexippus]